MLNTEIALVDGSNFQVVAAGEYTITVKAAELAPEEAIQEPLVMVTA